MGALRGGVLSSHQHGRWPLRTLQKKPGPDPRAKSNVSRRHPGRTPREVSPGSTSAPPPRATPTAEGWSTAALLPPRAARAAALPHAMRDVSAARPAKDLSAWAPGMKEEETREPYRGARWQHCIGRVSALPCTAGRRTPGQLAAGAPGPLEPEDGVAVYNYFLGACGLPFFRTVHRTHGPISVPSVRERSLMRPTPTDLDDASRLNIVNTEARNTLPILQRRARAGERQKRGCNSPVVPGGQPHSPPGRVKGENRRARRARGLHRTQRRFPGEPTPTHPRSSRRRKAPPTGERARCWLPGCGVVLIVTLSEDQRGVAAPALTPKGSDTRVTQGSS